MKTEHFQSENLINKVNKILKKIQNDPTSFENIFTELFEKDFNEQLDNINKVKKGKLKGLIISVKDLFDVKGYKTKGGTKFIDDKIAQKDAKCISLIRKAGGLLLGHTNMTELAYSGLGINPQMNGTLIMLPIPELNEERRKELSKVAAQYAEQARISIRNIRKDGMDQVKKYKSDGMSEDDQKFWENEVQEMTDDYVKRIDSFLNTKQDEIMQV